MIDIETVTELIKSIPHEKMKIEEDEDSIKYTLLVSNGTLLMVTKCFEVLDDLKDDEIVFSLFKNKKRIASDVSNVNDFVIKFLKYLEM